MESNKREFVQTETIRFQFLKNGRIGNFKVWSSRDLDYAVCLLDVNLARRKSNNGNPMVRVGYDYVCSLVQNENALVAVKAYPLKVEIGMVNECVEILFSNDDSAKYVPMSGGVTSYVSVLKKLKGYNFFNKKQALEDFEDFRNIVDKKHIKK